MKRVWTLAGVLHPAAIVDRLDCAPADMERTLKYALDVSQRLVVSREFRHQVRFWWG